MKRETMRPLIYFILTVLVGTGVHFLYDWSPNVLFAMLSPVRESVWEHGKLIFWPMLAALTGEPVPAREDIEAKKQIILRHGLALWDTLESCTITGASDASIRDVVPNDIAGLLAKAPIEAVFCNGATAYKIYTKYLEPVSGIPAVRLPSTSPANAACRPEKLREIWQKELSNWILP